MSCSLHTGLAWNVSVFHSTLVGQEARNTPSSVKGPHFPTGLPRPRPVVSAPPVPVHTWSLKTPLLLCRPHPLPKEKQVMYGNSHGRTFGKPLSAWATAPFLRVPGQVSGLLRTRSPEQDSTSLDKSQAEGSFKTPIRACPASTAARAEKRNAHAPACGVAGHLSPNPQSPHHPAGTAPSHASQMPDGPPALAP